ncbi:rolling circle replication-associated protein [Soonwooa purpurea]
MVESVAKVKKRSVVYYKRFAFKKYNEKSKENLNQNQSKKLNENRTLQILKKTKSIDCINAFAETFRMAYENATNKTVKYCFSKNQASKISEITNVFISSILSSYQHGRGFKQRSITFCTLTLSEKQKHQDKEIVRALAKFIDDIKSVKNYIICPITKKQTNDLALPIKNYIWRAETTENGDIHFHILFDSFINKSVLNRVWNNHLAKLGYEKSFASTRIESLKKINDVGAYITKYMTKPPLKTSVKNMTKEQLAKLKDYQKYRRPVLAKQWGSSKSIMKLKYIDFVENDMVHVEELSNQMKEYISPELPDFVKVFVGDVKSTLKKCSIKLQSMFKQWYKRQFEILYKPIEKINPILEIVEKEIKYVIEPIPFPL